MRGLFNKPLGACVCAPNVFKCIEPVTTAALIGAGASLVSGAFSSASAANLNSRSIDYDWSKTQDLMYFNDEQARKAREHQTALLDKEQLWQEEMYNKYNSPSAMRAQYAAAGYNPYLVSSEGALGRSQMAANSPSPSAGPAASMGASGVPNLHMPDFSGIQNAGDVFARMVNMNANSANQQQQAVNQALENYAKMRKLDIPKDICDEQLQAALGSAIGSNVDASRYIHQFDLGLQAQELENNFNDLRLSVYREFGRTKEANELMLQEEKWTLMAAQIGRMAVQNKFDESTIEKFASEIARNFADARLTSANADVIEKSIKYLVDLNQYSAFKEYYQSRSSEGQYNISAPIYEDAKTSVGRVINRADRYSDMIVDKVGKALKINIGFGKHKSESRSFNTNESRSFNTNESRSFNTNDSYIHRIE